LKGRIGQLNATTFDYGEQNVWDKLKLLLVVWIWK
jgi:hypothetical protein